jgi:hypothetical protein
VIQGGVGHVRAKWPGGWRPGQETLLLYEPLIVASQRPLDGPRLALDLVSGARGSWRCSFET